MPLLAHLKAGIYINLRTVRLQKTYTCFIRNNIFNILISTYTLKLLLYIYEAIVHRFRLVEVNLLMIVMIIDMC